jgi:hypothetical protein
VKRRLFLALLFLALVLIALPGFAVKALRTMGRVGAERLAS